ncbi:hypothetical protein EBZ37_08545, partial [bacterium]|nr:hypothetical protein [bacterium]
GDGTQESKLVPTVIDSETRYSAVTSGAFHTCGITTTNAVKCWGYNDQDGVIGDGTTEMKLVPTMIDSGTEYRTVAAGYYHACGITTGNILKCWGYNSDGQIGDGTYESRLSPIVIDPGNSYNFISAGGYHNCGSTTGGVLKCWGSNSDGQLGDGTQEGKPSPTVIDSGSAYSSIALGQYHSCGITSEGGLKCWGWNSDGQLGNGSNVSDDSSYDGVALTPTLIEPGVIYSTGITATQKITAGETHSCSIGTDGTLKCWGDNSYGQLGDGTTKNRVSPMMVQTDVSYAQVSAGSNYTCAITSSGQLRCWGYNYNGQLGDGTGSDQYSPVVVDPGVSYSAISTGYSHACGITTAGALKCWGNNDSGQLGNGDTTNQLLPVPVDEGTVFGAVSVGKYNTTCAITTSGTLKCWGANQLGQLGDTTTTSRLTPVSIDGATRYLEVAVGSQHTCGITTDYVLKCWGSHGQGQLGVSTAPEWTASPIVVHSGTSYKSVKAGYYHTCGITSSNELYCWGNNGGGEVGDGSQDTTRTAPVRIDSGVYYSALTTGGDHTCGITTSGTLKCWGYDNSGKLGRGRRSLLLPMPVFD